MKTAYNYILPGTLLLALSGCVADAPFAAGEGELRMRMVINSELTRAETEEASLGDDCSIYILSGENILHKFEGIANLPSSLALRSGHYTAEAYAGVKSYASFTDKYYKGAQEFDITTGVTSVVLNCRISNVAAQVNAATIDPDMIKNYKITVGTSKGSLEFTDENISLETIGYFTMPEDETALTYTVEGENADGVAFSKSGTIANVQPAHLYSLNLSYNPDFEEYGGSYITVTIDQSEILIESEVEIYGAPEVKGMEFELDKQINGAKGSFTEKLVRVRAYGDLKSLYVDGGDNITFFDHADGRAISSIDLLSPNTSESNKNSMREAGIEWTPYESGNGMTKGYLKFSAAFLNSLPVADTEYCITITAGDSRGKSTVGRLRIANTDAAVVIDDPVIVVPVDQTADLMAVGATTAVIPVTLADADVVNPVVQYREAGTADEWQEVPVVSTRASVNTTVTLTGLKPGVRYEYRAAAEGFAASESFFITTESKFIIPNASFEEWGTYSGKNTLGMTKDMIIPAAGDRADAFWESGNGAGMVVLTDKSTDMVHSGTYSAKLASTAVMGNFAAGNVFTGVFGKATLSPLGAQLTFGRPYNGSHPTALKVWANYRPGTVNYESTYIAKGATDHGQIYCALSTEAVAIDTGAGKMFNPDADCIVAYGEQTWTSAFGPDGALEEISIPLTYKSHAKTAKPLYLIIVVSASKFGDYFSGSSSSVMYLDDFELVY